MTLLWDDQTRLGELRVGRRTTVVAGLSGASILGLADRWPNFVERRRDLTTGVRSGEVTTNSAVLWSRAVEPSRMMARLYSGGLLRRTIRGRWADPRTDFTARMHLTGLAAGREFEAEVWFETPEGERSAPQFASFATAPIHGGAQTIVWSGDTNGQGWGIDRSRGGMTGYRAMLDLRPDLFIHVGDTIYADEPMESSKLLLENGSTWQNELTEEVMVVAETLDHFRGRHRYPLRDDNVREFYAAVPSAVQWDDHETCNNWWPGETIDDERYTERRADVLALRGRRAWQEYQPVPVERLVSADGDGFAPTRIYRTIPRGQHLDLFLLDMRSFRGSNPEADPRDARAPRGMLGSEQEDWLIASLRRSTATWKVISIDQPLSAPVRQLHDLDGIANGDHGRPMGREPEIGRILSAIKRYGVKNVVWITADVHYTAANHYSPERATFTDFDPFWEFISGPLHCSPFTARPDELDRTFGPLVHFTHGKDEPLPVKIAPRPDNQHIGQLAIAPSGELTVRLYDAVGTVLWQKTLEPDPAGQSATASRSSAE
ncbi:alkaline phosphatase D family protein [Nocardioides sp. WS12]|uniref:alkaline phosphatase D family protein n=1 Tax=Nocardioides sp. WS12 TaxID=2486272 RepID=UPI00191E681A|nr:alkaline phosphatase D family protein [Nocardioides sp. WS12]